MDIEIGSIVYSKAGRDKGNFFVVIAIDGEYAFICDGDLRKTEKPKKKKLKHLKVINEKSEFVVDRLVKTGRITNSEIRKSLAQYRQI